MPDEDRLPETDDPGLPAPTPDDSHPAAGRGLWIAFLVLAAVVVVTDQLTKLWIVSEFELGVPVPVVGDLIRITPIHNDGAIFGMLSGTARLFGAISVPVVVAIVWFEARSGRRSRLLTVALGLLLGGALGNLPDRLLNGYVLDFLDGGIGTWRWYTSNVADIAISLALVLLVGFASLPRTADRPSAVEATGEADTSTGEPDAP